MLVLLALGCGQSSSADGTPDDEETGGSRDDDDGSSGAATTTATDGGPSSDADTSEGSSDSGPAPTMHGAFPAGLAVASPTASLGGPPPNMPPGMPLHRSIDALTNGTRTLTAMIQRGKPYAVKQAELAAMLDGSSCELVLGDGGGGFNPMCYGPSLEFTGHPDATMGAPADGQLPGGDLGLWSAAEADGTACAAAKLNGLVDDVALAIDYGIYLSAHMQCEMVVDGTAAPEIGALLDRTDSVHASLSTSNPGVTVSNASLRREADEGDRSVFVYEIAIAIPTVGPQPLEMHMTMRHAAKLDDANDYRGRLWSRVDHQSPNDDMRATTLDYAQDGTGLRYDLVAAAFAIDAADPFDASGMLDFGAPWTGNATRAAVELDPDTGDASVAFAWQAGHFDDKSRVFNVATQYDAPDEGTGCGFFGFGAPFDDGGASDAAIATFVCNWAGPGNSHVGEIGFAQKQCMETDAMGKFVATESHVVYGPVNDCDTGADPGFTYRPMGAPDWDSAPLVRDLVELASDPDYASWLPPASP